MDTRDIIPRTAIEAEEDDEWGGDIEDRWADAIVFNSPQDIGDNEEQQRQVRLLNKDLGSVILDDGEARRHIESGRYDVPLVPREMPDRERGIVGRFARV